MTQVSYWAFCVVVQHLDQLKCLWNQFLTIDREGSTAFATMLQRLPSLEELGPLRFVDNRAWREVRQNGGHDNLKKLVFDISDGTKGQVDDLVGACVDDFPALEELELHFADMNISIDDIVRALVHLNAHPSLPLLKTGALGGRRDVLVGAVEEIGHMSGLRVIKSKARARYLLAARLTCVKA